MTSVRFGLIGHGSKDSSTQAVTTSPQWFWNEKEKHLLDCLQATTWSSKQSWYDWSL